MPSHAEALTTGAACLGIRIGELEPAGHQCAGVVAVRAFKIKGALAVDDHAGTARRDQDIAALRPRHELHLVAQAVAAATADGDPEEIALLLACDERSDLGAGRGGEADEVL